MWLVRNSGSSGTSTKPIVLGAAIADGAAPGTISVGDTIIVTFNKVMDTTAAGILGAGTFSNGAFTDTSNGGAAWLTFATPGVNSGSYIATWTDTRTLVATLDAVGDATSNPSGIVTVVSNSTLLKTATGNHAVHSSVNTATFTGGF
jgi:hypothetical protein